MSEGQWGVEYTDEFEAWWHGLTVEEQEALAARVDQLAAMGPSLRRPTVGEVAGSKVKNLKELRASVGRSQLRVLFAFDPRQVAILLLGGDKAEGSLYRAWYRSAVVEAERLYLEHLDELRREGLA